MLVTLLLLLLLGWQVSPFQRLSTSCPPHAALLQRSRQQPGAAPWTEQRSVLLPQPPPPAAAAWRTQRVHHVLHAYSPGGQRRGPPGGGGGGSGSGSYRPSGGIDGRQIEAGSLIEYVSGKGSKRLAIVHQRVGAHLEVLNDAKKAFSVPLSRVTHHINGSFAFGDLLRLTEVLAEMKPIQVERLWEASFDQPNAPPCTVAAVSRAVYGSADPVRLFVTTKLMATFGGVFFVERSAAAAAAADATGGRGGRRETVYVPLPPDVVQENLRNRAALKEFKLRFNKIMVTQPPSRPAGAPGAAANGGGGGVASAGSVAMAGARDPTAALLADMPERIHDVLGQYTEGLKQIVVKVRPDSLRPCLSPLSRPLSRLLFMLLFKPLSTIYPC
jgi:hypothetical protein